jgi:hypothetical protein
VRAVVIALMAIKRMSLLSRARVSQDHAVERETSVLPLHSAQKICMTLTERKRERGIGTEYEYVLSERLVQHLEGLVCGGTDVQKALDIMDMVRVQSWECGHTLTDVRLRPCLPLILPTQRMVWAFGDYDGGAEHLVFCRNHSPISECKTFS